MDEKTHAVLDAIRRGALAELPEPEQWLRAVQTVQGAQLTPDGIVLTDAGRHALEDIKMRRRRVH
jgi:hypothetical protein